MIKQLLGRCAPLAAACAALLLGAVPATAVAYPERAISLVVGYPAGGSVDLTARLFAEELAARLGQNVVVENVGGAGGTIGAQRVVRSKPDGYTLLLGSSNEIAIARMINEAVTYDGRKDFTSLGIIGTQPMLLAASKASGVTTAEQYLQALRSAPAGAFYYGSSGVGTTLHLAGEMISQASGTRAEHVPYRGVAPLVTDLMGGQLTFGMLVLSSGLPPVRNGNIVALGVTEAKRSAIAPEIPALAETPGFEDVDINIWFGLYGPAGLPADVAATLRQAVGQVLESAAFREKLAQTGGVPAEPGLDAQAFLDEQIEKYGALVDLAGIRAR
ncbi:tripartite tricarboxylate transporter substrate binding protein [Orrella sp. JC864]|uniref:Bug family tripartite tricarboxylate transporter substrate binding protein n=1 Tax=Orrella sp. JC864 TaxID=3120298 RepID=UPI00300937B8